MELKLVRVNDVNMPLLELQTQTDESGREIAVVNGEYRYHMNKANSLGTRLVYEYDSNN